jgi:hypothetical protein
MLLMLLMVVQDSSEGGRALYTIIRRDTRSSEIQHDFTIQEKPTSQPQAAYWQGSNCNIEAHKVCLVYAVGMEVNPKCM